MTRNEVMFRAIFIHNENEVAENVASQFLTFENATDLAVRM
jgi:hypothetical protein